jgi:hypothetical protein
VQPRQGKRAAAFSGGLSSVVHAHRVACWGLAMVTKMQYVRRSLFNDGSRGRARRTTAEGKELLGQ